MATAVFGAAPAAAGPTTWSRRPAHVTLRPGLLQCSLLQRRALDNSGPFLQRRAAQPRVRPRIERPSASSHEQGIHVVEPDETLYSIAQRYHSSVRELRALNPSLSGVHPLIQPGDRITIPALMRPLLQPSSSPNFVPVQAQVTTPPPALQGNRLAAWTAAAVLIAGVVLLVLRWADLIDLARRALLAVWRKLGRAHESGKKVQVMIPGQSDVLVDSGRQAGELVRELERLSGAAGLLYRHGEATTAYGRESLEPVVGGPFVFLREKPLGVPVADPNKPWLPDILDGMEALRGQIRTDSRADMVQALEKLRRRRGFRFRSGFP